MVGDGGLCVYLVLTNHFRTSETGDDVEIVGDGSSSPSISLSELETHDSECIF